MNPLVITLTPLRLYRPSLDYIDPSEIIMIPLRFLTLLGLNEPPGNYFLSFLDYIDHLQAILTLLGLY